MDIKSLLESSGYKVSDFGNYYKTQALWRSGSDPSSVTIYKDGHCIDHVTGEHFSHEILLCRVLGIEDKDKLKIFLESSGSIIENSQEIQEPIIKSLKLKNKDFLLKLDRTDEAHSYWINRGISLDVLKELQGGVYKDKYYFPIFNSQKNLLGWSARIIKGKSDKKYVIGGEKKNFVYPAFVCSKDIIGSKKVYLHEGIPDAASLMTLGIRNNLVLFGTEISFAIINYLLRIDNVKIVICQNNDKAGYESGPKIQKKLLKYFDYDQVKIIVPPTKDINQFLVDKGRESVLKWIYEN